MTSESRLSSMKSNKNKNFNFDNNPYDWQESSHLNTKEPHFDLNKDFQSNIRNNLINSSQNSSYYSNNLSDEFSIETSHLKNLQFNPIGYQSSTHSPNISSYTSPTVRRSSESISPHRATLTYSDEERTHNSNLFFVQENSTSNRLKNEGIYKNHNINPTQLNQRDKYLYEDKEEFRDSQINSINQRENKFQLRQSINKQDDSHLESGSPQQYFYQHENRKDSDLIQKGRTSFGYTPPKTTYDSTQLNNIEKLTPPYRSNVSPYDKYQVRSSLDRMQSPIVKESQVLTSSKNNLENSTNEINVRKLENYNDSDSSEEVSEDVQDFLRDLLKDEPKKLEKVLFNKNNVQEKDTSINLANQILEKYSTLYTNNENSPSKSIDESKSLRHMTLDERRSVWKEQAQARQLQSKSDQIEQINAREELNKLFESISERIQSTTHKEIDSTQSTESKFTSNIDYIPNSDLNNSEPSIKQDQESRYLSPTKSSSLKIQLTQDRNKDKLQDADSNKKRSLTPRQKHIIDRDLNPNSNKKIMIKSAIDNREIQRNIQQQQNRERQEIKDTLTRLSKIASSRDVTSSERKIALERMSLLEELIVRRVKDRLGDNEYNESTSLISPRTSKPTRSQNVPITTSSPRLSSPIRGSPGVSSSSNHVSRTIVSPKRDALNLKNSSNIKSPRADRFGFDSVDQKNISSPNTRTQLYSPIQSTGNLSSVRSLTITSPRTKERLASPQKTITSPRTPTRLTSPKRISTNIPSTSSPRTNLTSPRRNAHSTVSSIKEKYEQRQKEAQNISPVTVSSPNNQEKNHLLSIPSTEIIRSPPKPRLMEYEEKQAQEKILSKRASLQRKQLLEKISIQKVEKPVSRTELIIQQVVSNQNDTLNENESRNDKEPRLSESLPISSPTTPKQSSTRLTSPRRSLNSESKAQQNDLNRPITSPTRNKIGSAFSPSKSRESIKSPPKMGFGSSSSRF